MGKYKRKTDRGSYSKEKLREAVREVESGRMSGYGASKKYEIPRMTIMDHVNRKRVVSTTLGRNTALSHEIEYTLASCLHTMEKYGFGLSRKEVLVMVGEYVNQNDLDTPFKNGIPGKDWFLAFKERHGLSIKKPQGVEYARKRAVDPFIVYPYFDLLEKTICDLNLKNNPSAIWNLDETSFSKDPAKTKIVGAKGHAATRVISSPGRDNTTVLLGASASGEKTPPLIIYKGKHIWDTWTSPDAYPGTSYAATKNGWMESGVFESYFKKTFLPVVKAQRPVLLIYDGHSTHVGLNIIEEARKEGITILKLPAHTSHILQPLDIAVMKSFKDRWDPLLVQWQRLNVGSVMPKREFARLIGQVWSEIDPQVLRNGFRRAGICPVNLEEIKEDKFDALKLKHWRECESRHLFSTKEQESPVRKPKSLQTIVSNFVQETLEPKGFEIPEENLNCNEPLETSVQDQNVSFEELLLLKLNRGDNSAKPQRRRVAPGAEVITHDDVLEKKREEQNKNVKSTPNKRKENLQKQNKNLITSEHIKKEKKTKAKKQTKILKSYAKDQNDVVYLKQVSRNDCQVQRFVAQDISNIPHCLQRHESDSKKIIVLSNVVIKEPDTEYKKEEEKKDNIYENPKPGPSGLRKVGLKRRHSSTSVSGSISSHSDSDIIDIKSDSTVTDEDEIYTTKLTQISNEENFVGDVIIPDVDKENEIPVDNAEDGFNPDVDTEQNEIPAYVVGDNVLVRYHMRQKWRYYVGIVEDTKIIDDELYYSVKFYETIKKPKLTFRITKNDRDDVPEALIVKKVNLIRNPDTLNKFSMSSDEDATYFYE